MRFLETAFAFQCSQKILGFISARRNTPRPNPYRPKALPKQVTSSGEIRGYGKFVTTKDETFQREAKHGYYACVSYIDAQIGLILDELDRLGLSENTIVVILGDHGWHLGEHGFWGKHNLMNHATRAPLIVRVPHCRGGKAKGIVEFVDIYPTLCELCGVPMPKDQLQEIGRASCRERVSSPV